MVQKQLNSKSFEQSNTLPKIKNMQWFCLILIPYIYTTEKSGILSIIKLFLWTERGLFTFLSIILRYVRISHCLPVKVLSQEHTLGETHVPPFSHCGLQIAETTK